jgi:hypothetical protein
LGRLLETAGHVLEQTPAVDHAKDANAVRLDTIHQPVLVHERLAPVWILEFRDHAEGIGEVDKPISGLLDGGHDLLGIGRGVARYVLSDGSDIRARSFPPGYSASHFANCRFISS